MEIQKTIQKLKETGNLNNLYRRNELDKAYFAFDAA